jgi:hypothetical protein
MDQEKINYIATVTENGYALQFASIELRGDKDVVLPAVTQYGYGLQFASVELRADKKIVLTAVTQNAFALQYASVELREDKEVVLAAVTQEGLTLKYASLELRNDEYFLWEVDQICKIKVNSNIFYYISERIKDKIRENLDYLLDFEPIYLKPCKK